MIAFCAALLLFLAWSCFGPKRPAIAVAALAVAFLHSSATAQNRNIDQQPPIGSEAPADTPADTPASTPADERWHVTILTLPGCPPCRRLERDLVESPTLAKLFSATASPPVSVIVADTSSREGARWRAVPVRGYPSILIQPPASGRYGDQTKEFKLIAGYNTPSDLAAAFLAFVAEQREKHPAPEPRRPDATPTPEPTPEPPAKPADDHRRRPLRPQRHESDTADHDHDHERHRGGPLRSVFDAFGAVAGGWVTLAEITPRVLVAGELIATAGLAGLVWRTWRPRK